MVEAVLQIDGQTSRLLWESNQRKIKGVLIQWKRSFMLFFTIGDQVTESQCINIVRREQTGGVGGKEIAILRTPQYYSYSNFQRAETNIYEVVGLQVA